VRGTTNAATTIRYENKSCQFIFAADSIMSSMNFSTSKQYVRPPQRGIFPLDHDAECKNFIDKYLECLNDSNDVHHKCKQLSKEYLQCRMDNKLMSKENLNDVSALFVLSIPIAFLSKGRAFAASSVSDV